MGHPIYLKAKAGEEKSMLEKRKPFEDVYEDVLQAPYDMAKAGLPEFQSPVVQPHTRGSQRLLCHAIKKLTFKFRASQPSFDGR